MSLAAIGFSSCGSLLLERNFGTLRNPVDRLKPSLSSDFVRRNPKLSQDFRTTQTIVDLFKFPVSGGIRRVRESSHSCGRSRAMSGGGSSSGSGSELLVVGPGVLGLLVAANWLQGNPGSLVVGQTRSTVRHEDLRALGISPRVRNSQSSSNQKFSNVIFCAPPSGSDDYAAEVRLSAEYWNGEGAFLFTSSSGLYDVEDNGPCVEDSPVVPLGKSPRTDRLLLAEKAVLEAGGSVIRFAGLYLLNRGAHTFWLKKGEVDSRPDHILNLIHYEDAATLCLASLRERERGKIYMGCDNHPVSRKELMDIVARSGKFENTFKGFTGTTGPLGKRMNNNKTREELQWEPKYKSFADFFDVKDMAMSSTKQNQTGNTGRL